MCRRCATRAACAWAAWCTRPHRGCRAAGGASGRAGARGGIAAEGAEDGEEVGLGFGGAGEIVAFGAEAAEDRAEAAFACRQVGPIRSTGKLKDGEEVFKERTSLVFKTMQVVRFFDSKRNTLVYLVYSDRVIEGSPQNAVTAIPILPWGQQ